MTRVYLVRHAEAEGNLFRRAQGQFNGMVTATGRRQIEALRQRFLSVPVEAVYASDLLRTRLTAAAITEPKGLTLRLDKALREFSIGQWEDVPWAEWQARDSASMTAFNTLDHFSAPGSETPEQVRDRITAAFWRIARENEGKTIAIVSHGMAIRILLGTLQGLSFPEMRQTAHSDNTAVSLVEVEGDAARVVFRDDNSHLGALSTFAKQSWWRDKNGGPEPSLRFRSPALPEEGELFLSLMRRAWEENHDPLDHFSPEDNLSAAERLLREDPGGVRLAIFRDQPAGLVIPMTESCWFYLLPELRGRRLGIQLIGEGVAVLRRRGEMELRSYCETDAVADYLQYYGFAREGRLCRLGIVPEASEL
ncbi:MAG: histidine phosphatase family protein [Oscillospiraceae bacterium]